MCKCFVMVRVCVCLFRACVLHGACMTWYWFMYVWVMVCVCLCRLCVCLCMVCVHALDVLFSCLCAFIV